MWRNWVVEGGRVGDLRWDTLVPIPPFPMFRVDGGKAGVPLSRN